MQRYKDLYIIKCTFKEKLVGSNIKIELDTISGSVKVGDGRFTGDYIL